MKKLKLDDLKVQSFVTDLNPTGDQTNNLKGGWTGNCLSFIYITCPDPDCDFHTIGETSECCTQWGSCPPCMSGGGLCK